MKEEIHQNLLQEVVVVALQLLLLAAEVESLHHLLIDAHHQVSQCLLLQPSWWARVVEVYSLVR